jgi:isocitrate/isopropylmalate dehydrogenase
MKTYKIIVLPGDGIGPAIMDGTLEVLGKVQELSGNFRFDVDFHRAGAAFYLESGENITSDTIRAIREADATLKGPVGLPWVRNPDGTEAGLLGGVLRVGLDLYANLRPIRLFPSVWTPLREKAADSIDYLLLRENSEGLYLSRGVGLVTEEAATDTMMVTRKGCERIARFAFKLALEKKRGAPEDGRKRVTFIDKSNVLRSFHFFRTIFKQVAEEVQEVEPLLSPDPSTFR